MISKNVEDEEIRVRLRQIVIVRTLDVLGCLGLVCNSPLLLRSWGGVHLQRCEWRGATVIGQMAQRQAVNALKGADFEGDGAQNSAQSQKAHVPQLAN